MDTQNCEIELIVYELATAKNRIEHLIGFYRQKYMSLNEAEKLGEKGWDIEEAINDLLAAKNDINSALKFLEIA